MTQEPVALPREMTGAELKSMLKSSINFKSLGGLKVPGLKLNPEDLQWWRDAKVGMFVHWGLYSILGQGEWARFNQHIPDDVYTALADQFNPRDFSMDRWTGLARDFGANYMVMVARHHDGFALWDSPSSHESFTSWNTASHRDFVREYSDACRRAGLRCGLYYSPMDWRFPGYFDPEGLPESAQALKRQCYGQVEELMSRYGQIDVLWYDGSWLAHKGSDTSSAWLWEPDKLNAMVRRCNPKTVINPRSGWEGDFYCDEGSHPIQGNIIPVPWEKNMCACSGASWGWMENDPVQSFGYLIKMLADVVTRDGNWLLNVGPDKDGRIPPQVEERLQQVGAWLRQNGEAVYRTRGGPFQPVDDVYGSTFRDNRIYLHIQDCSAFSDLTLPEAPGKVTSCRMLNGGPVAFRQEDGIKIQLPEGLPETPDTIVQLTLDRPVPLPEATEVYFTGKE